MMYKSEEIAQLVLVIHNVRSAHNVGSLFRSADGAGVKQVFLSGYSPRPARSRQLVLSVAEKELRKTALGAEASVSWTYLRELGRVAKRLHQDGYSIVALEQSPLSQDYRFVRGKLLATQLPLKVALLVGNEVLGLSPRALKLADVIMELPMRGEKESLNVSVAGGIALYELQATIEEAYANKKRSRQ